MIEVARLHAASQNLKIDYRVQAAQELAAAAPGAFDIVTCMELLEHVPQPAATTAALAGLTRAGGAVFVSTINRNLKSFVLAIVAAEYVLQAYPARHARLRAPHPPGGACALGARRGPCACATSPASISVPSRRACG